MGAEERPQPRGGWQRPLPWPCFRNRGRLRAGQRVALVETRAAERALALAWGLHGGAAGQFRAHSATVYEPTSRWPSEALASIQLPCTLACGLAQAGVGVTCPPFSPAQGSSSKAWHCLSFLQNIHNNINNNILDMVGLGRCTGVHAWQAGAYEGQGRVLAPAWALCCRSSGCGGGAPGRAQCSTRFLIQPVMPEENLPPVSAATLGAPPM